MLRHGHRSIQARGWSMPGFAAFDGGGVESAEATAEAAPVDTSDEAADASAGANRASGDEVADSAPEGKQRKTSVVESIESPAVAERRAATRAAEATNGQAETDAATGAGDGDAAESAAGGNGHAVSNGAKAEAGAEPVNGEGEGKDRPAEPSVADAIRARIHDSAIKRVTRTYAATLGDIFTELLQNARRAGAARVRVAVSGPPDTGPFTVTVTDDGAGMGMLSLARRGCTVSSRPRAPDDSTAPGWRVVLLPEHFLGEADTQVQSDDTAPWPHGTTVTFRTAEHENADSLRKAIGTAAWHYPLPVVFEHAPHTPSEGELLERRAFLDGALHAERWRGLVFGVFKDRWAGFGLNDPDVNFHGLTVSVRLPSVESVAGPRWSVAADIEDCPDLELVLPARKEAVETPFLDEMRGAARLVIYRAMAAHLDPRPAFEDWKRAKDAGIGIAPSPPELRPWRPGRADIDDWRKSSRVPPYPSAPWALPIDAPAKPGPDYRSDEGTCPFAQRRPAPIRVQASPPAHRYLQVFPRA